MANPTTLSLTWRRCLTLLTTLFLAQPVLADDAGTALTIYTGQYSNDALVEQIILNQNGKIRTDGAYIAAVALSQRLSDPERPWQWEVEGQYAQAYGLQDHQEFNVLAVLRWKDFPWNRWLPTTFALGDGVSYADRIPKLEAELNLPHGSHKWLNYFLMETTFAPALAEGRWSLVLRIHHRCGVVGLFNGMVGGSNHIGVGMKFLF